MKALTKYQTVIYDDQAPVKWEDSTPTPPPVDFDSGKDITSLGILGRVGVASR
jgi:hypothetical protein